MTSVQCTHHLKILTRLKSLFPSRGKPLGVSGEHGGLADIIEAKIEHTDTLHPYKHKSIMNMYKMNAQHCGAEVRANPSSCTARK